MMEELIRRLTELERRLRGVETQTMYGGVRGCRVIRTTAQSIPHHTMTALSFDTEIYDTDDCWSSAEPTRLYARTAGWYVAGGGWARSADQNPNASRQWAAVRMNETALLGIGELHTMASRNAIVGVAVGMFWMNVGDYIEIVAYQDSGAARDTAAASTTFQPFCHGWLMRVA